MVMSKCKTFELSLTDNIKWKAVKRRAMGVLLGWRSGLHDSRIIREFGTIIFFLNVVSGMIRIVIYSARVENQPKVNK